MRIPQGLTYQNFLNDIMDLRSSINDIGRRLSTGKSVNRPSDDPVNAKNILVGRVEVGSLAQFERNITQGLTYLGIAEQAIFSAKNIVSRVQEIAVSQATGTASSESRAQAASEVQNLFDELVAVGNTKFQGKYIFSGYKTNTAAFDASGVYQGDANRYAIKSGPSSTVTIGVNGGEVFSGAGGGTDLFQTVSNLITALGGNDQAGIQAAVRGLQSGFDQLGDKVADLGGKVNRLTSTESMVSRLKHETELVISGLEDADLAHVISEFQLKQNALEAALTSAGRVFGVNIFNYL